MLDRLVESRSNSQENTRRTGFLLTVFVLMTMLMVGGWLYSLFAKDFGMSDNLQLSSLVAPVPVTEDKPPEPEPEKPDEKQKQEEKVDQTVRKEYIKELDQSTDIPDTKRVEKSDQKTTADPSKTKFDPNASRETTATNPSFGRPGDDGGDGGDGGLPPPEKKEEKKEEPKADVKPPPPPPPAPKPVPKIISGGVVNGKAISLPKPIYPAPARAVGAKGAVNVSVTIDENGNVISASATSGHPLLRQAAVAAARGARFAPTQLSGQPVKVSGIIIYNFNQ